MNKEELLATFGQPRRVLDKGHIRLVDVMGDDAAIVQAARVSYGEGEGLEFDKRKLMRDRATAFHMGGGSVQNCRGLVVAAPVDPRAVQAFWKAVGVL